jgi:hypothetical protein
MHCDYFLDLQTSSSVIKGGATTVITYSSRKREIGVFHSARRQNIMEREVRKFWVWAEGVRHWPGAFETCRDGGMIWVPGSCCTPSYLYCTTIAF